MDSFPREFLCHLTPTLMVGGLSPKVEPPSATNSQDASTSTKLMSPHSLNNALASVILRLIKQVTGSNAPAAIWDPPRPVANLQVMSVDKRTIRFPPRKRLPNDANPSTFPMNHAHSPLSPLTHASPLFPDGIMSPIWIRKHQEMSPAVWLDFYELKDYIPEEDTLPSNIEPLGVNNSEKPIISKYLEESMKIDREFSKEILKTQRHVLGGPIDQATSRRPYTAAARYIVVVCLRPHHMNDPSIETRISALRQITNMDNRTLLFMPLPMESDFDQQISASQAMTDFINSLITHIYDLTISHHREHTKRIRKKKSRVLPPPLPPHTIAELQANPNPSTPLGAQGWHLRYEYKLGSFAELRGEIDVAIKHYEACYAQLIEMFASTVVLPPRTKRWAEAKVLADCLNLKILKLHMYMDATSLAMARFNMHIAKFRDFSNGWGIGVETFEYWAWLCKQYRALGDLVDMALKAEYRLIPIFQATSTISASVNSQQQPLNHLQHPGYYYYAAAVCTMERMERFKHWLISEGEDIQNYQTSKPNDTPARASERKFDHWGLVIELLTKAYEHFRKSVTSTSVPKSGPSSGHGRVALFIASEIAHAYAERGLHAVDGQQLSDSEMALKFYERITRTYRKEGWFDILGSILSTVRLCATRVVRPDIVLETCFERLSPRFRLSEEERNELQTEIEMLINKEVEEILTVKIDLDHTPSFLSFYSQFSSLEIHPGKSVVFQFCIIPLENTIVRPFRFSQMEVHFSDKEIPSLIIEHRKDEKKEKKIIGNTRFIKVNSISNFADLTVDPITVLVFEGTIIPRTVGDLKVKKIILHVSSMGHKVEMTWSMRSWNVSKVNNGKQVWYDGTTWTVPNEPRNLSVIKVVPRRPRMEIGLKSRLPGYVGEIYPVEIVITNQEEKKIRNIVLDVKVQTNPNDDNVVRIMLDKSQFEMATTTTSLRNISLEDLEVGQNTIFRFYMISESKIEKCKFDLQVLYDLSTYAELENELKGKDHDHDHDHDVAESQNKAAINRMVKTETLQVSLVHPFNGLFRAEARYDVLDKSNLMEEDVWYNYWIFNRISFVGSVEVLIYNLYIEWSKGFEQTWTSEIKKEKNLIFKNNSVYNSVQAIRKKSSVEFSGDVIGFFVIEWKRKSIEDGIPFSTLKIPISITLPRLPSVRLIADLPPSVRIHEPFTISFRIRNETNETVILQMNLEQPVIADSCVFSGAKAIHVLRIPPWTCEEDNPVLKYNFVALLTGWLVLPRLKVQNIRHAESDTGVESVPIFTRDIHQDTDLSVFVMPKFPSNTITTTNLGIATTKVQ